MHKLEKNLIAQCKAHTLDNCLKHTHEHQILHRAEVPGEQKPLCQGAPECQLDRTQA